jgi:hypothetical protein
MSLAVLLRRALRTRWLQLSLAGLLLVAQHGALTHALTHADLHGHGESVHAQVAHAHSAGHDTEHREDGPAGDVSEFCAFDLVYSQVLGGILVGHALTFTAAEQVLVVIATLAVRNSVTVVPYDSRGPPALS